ncbi:odorant receptor Or1-like isoform X2 [Phymastichus coffea]|uniref:odorant receptor Or1-like isoform X2 n=1 Tax=Phymastichus coffea TaxID=108790 RepID=UPI00273C4DC4|nr:odorant receptor Or1-like isoform X2 [Phymastichus coffea]
MHVLQLPFKLLSITGIWQPVDWVKPWKKCAYVLFSLACIGLFLVTHLSMLGYLLTAKTWEQLSDRMFLIPTGISGLHKLFFVIANRQRIIDLADSLLSKCCLPRNEEELAIQTRYDETIRSITVACTCLVNVTMLNLVALPLLPSSSSQTLPLKVWLPYRTESMLSYSITYVHQSLGIVIVGTSAVGCTIMINGFLFLACAQFELLSHRFHKLPEMLGRLRSSGAPQRLIRDYETSVMKENVRHHLFIFSFAETFNDIFKSVILQQFCLSSIVVSVSVYQLSTRQQMNMEFLMCFFYLICVLTEFLVYCWFGNEIMFEPLPRLRLRHNLDFAEQRRVQRSRTSNIESLETNSHLLRSLHCAVSRVVHRQRSWTRSSCYVMFATLCISKYIVFTPQL